MSLNDSINQSIVDFGLLHQILHGDASTSVTTEAGQIPTMAKVMVGISAKVITALTAASASTLTVSLEPKILTIPAGKSFQIGQSVTIADSTGENLMFGTVTNYSGTSLAVNVVSLDGTGTYNAWTVSLSGPIGQDGVDAYGHALQLGFEGSLEDWLHSLKGEPGDTGPAGVDGKDGKDGAPGADGSNGINGIDGVNGVDGKSAYQLAVDNGFQGSVQDYLASIKGKDGNSITIKDTLAAEANLPTNANVGDAYIVAGNIWVYGQSGWFNAGQFLGLAGAAGRSAYQIALDNGFVGNEVVWLTSLKGATGAAGADGQRGADGKSAYDLAVQSGFNGTVASWLNSLVGVKGEKGNDGVNGTNGKDGADGKSAYQVAIDTGSFSGSEQDWLASLKGAKGDQGVQGVPGQDGLNGVDGKDGANGVNGKTVRYGTGAPAAGLGTVDDFYIDTTANFIYGPKTAGGWPAGVNLIGPKGDPGTPGAKGDPGIKGDPGAAGKDGTNGTNGIDGAKGDTGAQGVPGVDGKTILYGSGAPAVGVGNAGDFYIDRVASFIYGPKTAGWPAGVSLTGPKGDTGNAGAAGVDGKTVRYGTVAPTNAVGNDGDFYIDTVAHVIYGPKATTWPAGTSLVGPQGQKGDPGSQGTPGAPGTPGIVPTLTVVASEALSAGDFVNLYNNGGTLNVRRANAALGYRANGFVLAAVTSGANASVSTIGVNTAVTGQTVGDVFLQTTPGQAGVTVPSGSGQIVQNLGTALSATSINFESKLVITLA